MRPAQSKPYCIVLDNVGLYEEFGSPKSHREWSLDASPRTRPDDVDGDGEQRLPREPLEEIDETLVVLEDVEMNTVDELRSQIDELDKKIEELHDQITKLEDMGGFQDAIDGLLTKIDVIQSKKEPIERDLKRALDLQQDDRLKKVLEKFQHHIDSFFEDDYWETEEDKLMFMSKLKVSYDESKQKPLANLEKTIPVVPKPIDRSRKPNDNVNPRKELEVTLNNKLIEGKFQSQVFFNTIKEFGIERVRDIRVQTSNGDLISENNPSQDQTNYRKWTKISENRWVFNNLSSGQKKNILEEIAEKLGERIEVKII